MKYLRKRFYLAKLEYVTLVIEKILALSIKTDIDNYGFTGS